MIALLGVVLLTEPWHGPVDTVGIGLAAGAARGLSALYPAHPACRGPLDGLDGLSLTAPIAAAATAVVGIPQASGHLNLRSSRATRPGGPAAGGAVRS